MKSPLVPLLLPVLAPFTAAQVVDVNSDGAVSLAGDAVQMDGRIRLAGEGPGAVWLTQRVDVKQPFALEATVRLAEGAEGLALVVQSQAADALGGDRWGLGFEGIQRSVAIELDASHSLACGDPSENHVAVLTAGAGALTGSHALELGATSLIPDLDDGRAHTLRVESIPGLVRVSIDGAPSSLQVPLDLERTLGLSDGLAWIGFTAPGGAGAEVFAWSIDALDVDPAANRAPLEPTIVEPAGGDQPVDSQELSIVASSFADVDGDEHDRTEVEVWSMRPMELVWRASDLNADERSNVDLSTGTFLASHAGRSALLPNTAYVLRLRDRDASTTALTAWGPWAQRSFQTGLPGSFSALFLEDVAVDPAPEFVWAAGGTERVLEPSATGAQIVLESVSGQGLLSIEPNDGITNTVSNPATLLTPVAARLRIEGGSAGFFSNPTDLVIVDDTCRRTRIFLPEISLLPGTTALYWVALDGSTWVAQPGQSTPQFTTLARGPALSWIAAQPDYQVEVVASGLTLPHNLAFVPNPGPNPGDPFLYVAELYGQIKVVTNDGSVSDYATGLLNFNPTGAFPGSGEQGLGSLVVDGQTGDVYLSYLYDSNGPHFPRVSRFTSADGGMTAGSETILLDMAGETQGQAHYIAHLEILPDRTMLVHMGDGFVASTARNPSSYRGKILRMNLDGTPPADNPFYDGAPFTAEDFTYVLGVRNPYGGRYRHSDAFHYCVENGPSVDRFMRVVPGRDYEWAGSNSHMQAFALYNWTPSVGPVNLAWIEEATFDGSGFPQEKWDRAYVSEAGPTYGNGPQFLGKKITEYEIDAAGQLVSGPTNLVTYGGTGRGSTVGLAAGSDGLYFTDLYRDSGSVPTATGANVLRIRYVGDDLGGCGALGQTYCDPSVQNSTGFSATLVATGSEVVADNDVTLEVDDLPLNSFGYFLASQTQGFSAQPGGSAGNLCLDGTIGRFVQLAQSSGSSGSFSSTIDLANLPPPLAVVSPGETWNFQAWFRDFQLVVTSNFTNGVSILFQ